MASSDQVEKGEKNPFIVSSTECHEGSMKVLVTAIGSNSVFGRMRAMIESDGDDYTPLQIKLADLAKMLSVVGATVAAVTVVVMIVLHLITFFSRGTAWDDEDWAFIVQAFITGVAILVLAIPEGLPLSVTISLAYSVKKMMKDTDKARANYYAYHTGQKWGEPVNYHLSIDSGYLEIEDIVDLIIKYTDVKLYR